MALNPDESWRAARIQAKRARSAAEAVPRRSAECHPVGQRIAGVRDVLGEHHDARRRRPAAGRTCRVAPGRPGRGAHLRAAHRTRTRRRPRTEPSSTAPGPGPPEPNSPNGSKPTIDA
ncbi:CHAD domain-containing protein [Amycolatopsis alkalitolerans]|uniref:CHAD domain-containing protein n=1 Tax=Amycolatopsis alkalitolerans TaxID=2547244 RepID=A0A5C4LRQ4_9PSEU|nr:CHAD domain-containing protein [Amycolatopsis alkalitolerans]